MIRPASILFGLLFSISIFGQELPDSYAIDLAPDIEINASISQVKLDDVDDQGNTVVWGWADLHAHQFSDLGFGGNLFFGSSLGSPDSALKESGEHGSRGLSDLIGNSLRGGGFPTLGHKTGGYPKFFGWPRWNTYNHQTMFYKWLHRAYLGGCGFNRWTQHIG